MKKKLINAVIRNGSYRSNGGYCFVCNDVRPYTVDTKKTEVMVRGVTFNYTEQIAHCAQCGKEVYAPDVNDANCRAREKAYAECKGMNDILNRVGDEN